MSISISARTNQQQFFSTHTRALLVCPSLEGRRNRTEKQRSSTVAVPASGRSDDARAVELIGLAQAIDLDVLGCKFAHLNHVRAATFLGKGKVAEIADLVHAENIELVILDCPLSPAQQQNLEKSLSAKVIDRTGLILEIFGRRARTREGVLQVELAHLAYQKSRLVRSWTHLERQRGGYGFLGGPGETQIEADRRLIEERMRRISQELEGVRRTRGLHRRSRRGVPFPVIALVGYTNAGKSTLFNRLTKSDALAKDMLFATLDPMLRRMSLPYGAEVILSDTVGFISDLPTTLVSAFRATLEEVLEADLILHVRDIAHDDTEPQRTDVESVLTNLGIDPACDHRLVEVWNKVDLLDQDGIASAQSTVLGRGMQSRPILVSALTGQGIHELLAAVDARLSVDRTYFEIMLDATDGAGLNWLYENSEVIHKSVTPDGAIQLAVRVTPDRIESLQRRFCWQKPCSRVLGSGLITSN